MLRIAVIVSIALSCGNIAAASYRLHTEPAHVRDGQRFDVVATGNDCERLFVGDPYGDGAYDQVTDGPGLVRVQVGYDGDLIPPCDQPPSEVRLPAGPLPAGRYRLELRGRVLFTDFDDLLETFDLEVLPATQKTSRVPALGWLSASALIAACAWLAGKRR